MTIEDALVVIMSNSLGVVFKNAQNDALFKEAMKILRNQVLHILNNRQPEPLPPVKSLFDTQTLLANGYYIVQRKTPGEPFYIRTNVENLDRQYLGMIDDHGTFHPNPSPDLPFPNPLTIKAWDTK